MVPKVWSRDWNVSPENLFEMQILWAYPLLGSTESETGGWDPASVF